MSRLSYRNQSKVFLSQASEELAKDDLCQASEKGWGAAATMVKAAAQARGWRHRSHVSLFRAVSRLAEEAQDDSLEVQFSLAGMLHTNYYENWLERSSVERNLREVAQFVERVDGLLTPQ